MIGSQAVADFFAYKLRINEVLTRNIYANTFKLMCRWEADSPSAALKSHLFVRNRNRIGLLYTVFRNGGNSSTNYTASYFSSLSPEQRLYQKHRSHIFNSFVFLAPLAVLLQGLQFNREQLIQMYYRQSNNVASGLRFLLLRGLTSICMQPLHNPPVLTHGSRYIPKHMYSNSTQLSHTCTVTARNFHTH